MSGPRTGSPIKQARRRPACGNSRDRRCRCSTPPSSASSPKGDVAVLERYGDPRRMLQAGKAKLTKVIVGASRGHQGDVRAEAWLAVAQSAIDLCGNDPA